MRRVRNNRELFNMNFGFFGIQFGWTLQMANMSAIYEFLGAKPDQIPILWLAAPLTGLLVQPVIGFFSDRTWCWLGRRRPYFLTGAILSTLALLAMPNVHGLLAAGLLLWVLDASINISMEPFRAFVSDLLPDEQRTRGFATQSLMIGIAAVFAALLPFLLGKLNLPVSKGAIPTPVQWAFYLGAVAFISAVAWTVVTTPEYPPEPVTAEKPRRSLELPPELWRLAPIQLLTWFGLFCFWLYFTPTVAHHVFNAPDSQSPLYERGVEWAGVCMASYSAVTFLFSFFLPRLAAAIGEGMTHALCLAVGGVGLLSIIEIHDPNMLIAAMACVGVAWTSILAMPYAILARNVQPDNAGLTMGVFNFFIVLPEITMALCFGWVMKNVLHENVLAVMGLGGCCLLAAAALSVVLLRQANGAKSTNPIA